jgi:transposase InsO family protein
VERLRAAGCSVMTACRLVGVSRSGSDAARQARPARAPTPDPTEEALRAQIHSITEAPPVWGYRRVWAWLRYREGIRVNKQRGSRLMKAAGLTVKPGRHGATRTPQPKPTATRPRQSWGIDRTTCLIPALGWADVVIVLDWDTKKSVGWARSRRSRRQEWEAALAMGVPAEFPQGVRGAGVKLVSDHGSQPTASGFMAALSPVGIEPVVTRDDHPPGECGDRTAEADDPGRAARAAGVPPARNGAGGYRPVDHGGRHPAGRTCGARVSEPSGVRSGTQGAGGSPRRGVG